MAELFSSSEMAPRPQEPQVYTLSYWLDSNNIIVEVGGQWENFACENQAYELTARRVIGRNLLDFVSGDVTRMYVDTLIRSALLQRRPLVRNYRCDSPTVRRDMEMRLSVEDSGLLRWEHRLVQAQPFNRSLAFRAANPVNTRNFLVRCSICNRLKSAGGWQEAEAVPEISNTDSAEVSVIYGVCPSCMGDLQRPTYGLPRRA